VTAPEAQKKAPETAQKPRWSPRFCNYPAAVAQIEAARRTGADPAALIDRLDVDGLTRTLLRRKFLT
jgi:hypothetical protein